MLWRVWTSLWTAVELEFLPVYSPTEEEKTDASLFARNVQKFIAEKSGRTCSSLGFEDCRLIQAGKLDCRLIQAGKLNCRLIQAGKLD